MLRFTHPTENRIKASFEHSSNRCLQEAFLCCMIATMFSQRFACEIRLTHHARKRMDERAMTETLLLDLIESGELRYKDKSHLWIFKAYPDRNDNLLCVAAALESVLVVKTVMHYFDVKEWE